MTDQLYIDEDWIEDGYYTAGIEVIWGSKTIFVPRSAMELVQTTPSYVYNLELNAFRNELKKLEESEDGAPFPQTHRHNTSVVLSGNTYARVIEIINDYVVEFEDGQYSVNLIGANSNVADRVVPNQVSVRAANSAGLVEVATAFGLDPASVTAIVAAMMAAAQATPIHSDVKKMNGAQVVGTGSSGDLWRGV